MCNTAHGYINMEYTMTLATAIKNARLNTIKEEASTLHTYLTSKEGYALSTREYLSLASHLTSLYDEISVLQGDVIYLEESA